MMNSLIWQTNIFISLILLLSKVMSQFFGFLSFSWLSKFSTLAASHWKSILSPQSHQWLCGERSQKATNDNKPMCIVAKKKMAITEHVQFHIYVSLYLQRIEKQLNVPIFSTITCNTAAIYAYILSFCVHAIQFKVVYV